MKPKRTPQSLAALGRQSQLHYSGYTNNSPFSDLNGTEYYFKAAQWVYAQGIAITAAFNGDEPCTRQYAMLYMYITAGKPEQANQVRFSDLPNQEGLRNAVYWGVNKGITNGTTDATFEPEKVCTRAQIVTFLYRYLAERQTTDSKTTNGTITTDSKPTSGAPADAGIGMEGWVQSPSGKWAYIAPSDKPSGQISHPETPPSPTCRNKPGMVEKEQKKNEKLP